MGFYGLKVTYIHYIPMSLILIPSLIHAYSVGVSILMLVHLIEEEKIVLLVEF